VRSFAGLGVHRIKAATGPSLRARSERAGLVTATALLFCIGVGAFATSEVMIVKEVGIGIARCSSRH
jgi:hypothetical protein